MTTSTFVGGAPRPVVVCLPGLAPSRVHDDLSGIVAGRTT